MLEYIVPICIVLLILLVVASRFFGAQKNTSTANLRSSQATLNSERIESKFESYNIDILHSFEQLRVSDLFSMQGTRKTTRTLAIVTFQPIKTAEVESIHNEILDGASLGTAFKRAGWQIQKQTVAIFNLPVDEKSSVLHQKMNVSPDLPLAVHAYDLSVSKENTHRYASVTEIHSSDYLTISDLENLFEVQPTEVSEDSIEKITTVINLIQ